MNTLVATHTDRLGAFGFGRGGMGPRGMSAALPAVAGAAAGASVGQGRREGFARAQDRFDGPRVGRAPAGSGGTVPAAAPIGHRVDITA